MNDEPQQCTCPLIDVSTRGPNGIKVAFVRGNPRGTGCPFHETDEMRNEIKAAEYLARYDRPMPQER
jgi:hypothetical protein